MMSAHPTTAEPTGRSCAGADRAARGDGESREADRGCGEHLMMSDPPEPSDADLVTASLQDPPAFGALFDRHAVTVHRYLDRRLGRDRADDLLGEVFRIAFERRASYRGEHPSARPWLFGIASNLVLKAHRHETRRLRALARLAPPAGAPDTDLARVEEALDASAVAAAVVPALLRLDPRDRAVVVLVAWEGLSHDEVAHALDIPVGTVRSRLNRARRILREHVDGRGDGPMTITLPQTPRRAV
jgi:RNA polymerase sigma-70 factor (ECF subfamily)